MVSSVNIWLKYFQEIQEHHGSQWHPSDSDAGWNSTQHPIWPQALSEEFTPAVNDWCMVLGSFDICRYWETYTNMFVAEPQSLKWTNDRVLCSWNNGLMLGGSFQTHADAGWKFGGCWMETVWGSKKTAKYLNWEFANIIYYNNSVSRNRVLPFIHWDTFLHTRSGGHLCTCIW